MKKTFEFIDKHINTNNIIRSILVMWLFFNATIFKYIPILLFNLDVNKISNNNKAMIILSCFASLCMAISLFLIYRIELINEFKKFKNNFLNNIDYGFKCWFLGLVIMIISNLLLLFFFKTNGANNENAVQALIKVSPILMMINASIFAPFNEEIVFRKTLKDVFKDKYIFIFLSFLIFGGVHVIDSAKALIDYLYIIPYGALGAAFAFMYYKSDSVFTSMFFHFIHNTILVIMSIIAL